MLVHKAFITLVTACLPARMGSLSWCLSPQQRSSCPWRPACWSRSCPDLKSAAGLPRWVCGTSEEPCEDVGGEENSEKSVAVKVLCCRIIECSHHHDGPLLDLLQEIDQRNHFCSKRKCSIMYTLCLFFFPYFVFKGKYSPPSHISKDAVFRGSPVLPVGGGAM